MKTLNTTNLNAPLGASNMKPLIEIINTDNEPNIIEQMESKIEITPELVKNMYEKLDNKQHFLVVFGTKKFSLVDKDFLARMHDYLIRKVK